MSTHVSVRAISITDAAAVAELSHQLGYKASVEATSERIQNIAESKDQMAFAACLDGEVVGWIEVSICRHLQSAPYALIGGLVVNQQVRSCGIGKRLCSGAENWAREQGVAVLRVRSQIARQEAHRFYIREGFRQTKVSAVFEKSLL